MASSTNNVTGPLRLITRKPTFNIPASAFHLKAFCGKLLGTHSRKEREAISVHSANHGAVCDVKGLADAGQLLSNGLPYQASGDRGEVVVKACLNG